MLPTDNSFYGKVLVKNNIFYQKVLVVTNIFDSYIFADDIESPIGAKLPLWMLGFLY